MDKFKEYIQQHAKELEVDEPSPKVWNNIRSKQVAEPKPTAKVFSMLRYAVAACIIALAGIGVWHLVNTNDNVVIANAVPKQEQTKPVENATENEDTFAIIPEIAKTDNHPTDINNNSTNENKKGANRKSTPSNKPEPPQMGMVRYVENSFMQVINIEKQRVNSSPLYAESPAYFNDFKNRMMQMDNDEKLLRKDIKENGPDSHMIDQLINIYQQKLNLLRQLQTEMNKLNNRYKQNKPASDSLGTYFLNI